MEERGLSMRELSLKANLNETAVKAIMQGRSASPRGNTLSALAQALGVSLPELMAWKGVSEGRAALDTEPLPHHRRITPETLIIREYDVTPRAGAGTDELRLDVSGAYPVIGEWSMPGDFLRAFVADPGGLAVIRVEGDSMEPDYQAGERLLVDTSKVVPTPPGVYVLWDGYGLVLKRMELIPSSLPPVVRLMSINPAYGTYERPLDDVRINGRVIGKWIWK